MNPYATAMESAALETDGVGLVRLLFRELRLSLEHASSCIEQGNHHGRAKYVSKALAILGELSRSLDGSAAPELADQLKALYEFLTRRILEVNAKPGKGEFAPCVAIVRTLEEAWAQAQSPVEEPTWGASARGEAAAVAALSICA
jgi:flagellar protein FliS